MKIKDIAKRSGFSATTVSDVLHGKRFPNKDVAQAIVIAFGGEFEELSELWHRLSVSVHHAVPIAPAGVQDELITAGWYLDNGEFYAAATQSITDAAHSIRVTYIRQYPPSDVSSPEAARYFATMLEWAAQPGIRSVSRIFGVPISSQRARENFVAYLNQHQHEVATLKNYQARVFEYSAQGDGLNMALFDQGVAYVAVSGHGPQNLNGMRLDNGHFTEYLVKYFDQLLLGCELLPEYLDRISA